jgi:serine phosphatase RsbU (regulator of sigma subunit)
MKKISLLIILLFEVLESFAQINKDGVPEIKNYTVEFTYGSEQVWCVTKDAFGNVYFGNQEKGVSRFDGTKWTNISIGNNSRIYSLASDDKGIVYVGSAYEFGYLQPDSKGKIQYVSLAERIDSVKEIRNVYSIVNFNTKAYYLTPKSLFIYDTKSDSLIKLRFDKPKLSNALRLVLINGRLIMSDNKEGLYEILDDKIISMPNGDFFKQKFCMTILPYDQNQLLLGTYNTGLFLYDLVTGKVNSGFIDSKLNNKLKEALITSGTNLGKDLFAIGTGNNEGLLIINKEGNIVEQMTKDNSDLVDNTIYALHSDDKDNSELWISTLGVISKAYPFIRKYSAKQGFESAVNEICKFKGEYYFSSDDGVYRSYTDKTNTLRFKKLDGINDQVFPLRSVKIKSDEFLLVGSPFGVFKSNGNEKLTSIFNFIEKKYPANIKKILQSEEDPRIFYFGLEFGGVHIFKYENGKWQYISRIKNITGIVSGIVEKKGGGLWMISDDPSGVYEYKVQGKDSILKKFTVADGVPDVDMNGISFINNELYIFTGTGIIRFDKATQKFVPDNRLTNGFSEGKYSINLFSDNDGDLWFSGMDGKNVEVMFRNTPDGLKEYHGILNLMPNAQSWDTKEFDHKLYFLKAKIAYIVDKADIIKDSTIVKTYFTKIIIDKDSTIMNGPFYISIDKNRKIIDPNYKQKIIPRFNYDMNRISFEWTTPYFLEELSTKYSYKLEGFDKNWTNLEGPSYDHYQKKEYTNLHPGHYTFKVKTYTVTGIIGTDLSYSFIVLKPYYMSWWFIIGSFLTIVFIVTLSIRTQILARDKKVLEIKVLERTAEISQKNLELQEKNRDITASIIYAERIQRAILPRKELLDSLFKEYFIIFKPRDIVSGDFYWGTKVENISIITAVDCTGHGVPGAFMSILGATSLNEIINKEYITHPGVILRRLRKDVINSLQQKGESGEQKDGMDIALCTIDLENMKLQFAGANNPFYLIRDSRSTRLEIGNQTEFENLILYEIKGDKMPISFFDLMDKFTVHEIDIQKGDMIYLFTDGFADQFGGPERKKLRYKNFKNLLLSHSTKSMEEQKDLLSRALEEWQGDYDQIDDILLIGVKIS